MISFITAANIIYSCHMLGFKGFPSKVKGKAVIETKNWVTIQVKSEDKKEIIELTIPKERCRKDE